MRGVKNRMTLQTRVTISNLHTTLLYAVSIFFFLSLSLLVHRPAPATSATGLVVHLCNLGGYPSGPNTTPAGDPKEPRCDPKEPRCDPDCGVPDGRGSGAANDPRLRPSVARHIPQRAQSNSGTTRAERKTAEPRTGVKSLPTVTD